jgi:hypothetical protein
MNKTAASRFRKLFLSRPRASGLSKGLTSHKIILHVSQGRMQHRVWTSALTSWFLKNDDFDSRVAEEAMVEAQCLLKWCASLRFVQGADFLADRMSIPLHPKMGQELWKVFISGDSVERCTELPDSTDDEEYILRCYTNMSDWLDETCGINDTHLAKHYANDEKSQHAEHVAAINGDVMLLNWLLKCKYRYCRFPSSRPKPRNERVLQELLTAGATNDARSSLPR